MLSEMLDIFPVVCIVGLGGGILAIAKGDRVEYSIKCFSVQ